MPERIDRFRGDYAFLSNFAPVEVRYPDYSSSITLTFPTVEHAYQAAKTNDIEKRKWVRDAETPADAKRRGQSLATKAGWNPRARVEVMSGLLRQKFSQQPFREWLLETGDAELIEGNEWHDQFWGDCFCDQHRGMGGLNWLGHILMKLRTEKAGA